MDEVLKFQVQYDDLQSNFEIVNYTLNFVYSYKVWDKRLVLVVVVILASLTCLVSFIVYKLRVVKRTKKELLQTRKKTDRMTIREQRKQKEEILETSVTVYSHDLGFRRSGGEGDNGYGTMNTDSSGMFGRSTFGLKNGNEDDDDVGRGSYKSGVF